MKKTTHRTRLQTLLTKVQIQLLKYLVNQLNQQRCPYKGAVRMRKESALRPGRKVARSCVKTIFTYCIRVRKDPLITLASLLRPGFYGPTVVVLLGFHCIFLQICSLEQYLGSLFRQVKNTGRYKVRIMQQEVLNRRCTLFECKHRKILST